MKIKTDMMLEACGSKRIVRFYPGTWKVIAPLTFEQTISGEKFQPAGIARLWVAQP